MVCDLLTASGGNSTNHSASQRTTMEGRGEEHMTCCTRDLSDYYCTTYACSVCTGSISSRPLSMQHYRTKTFRLVGSRPWVQRLLSRPSAQEARPGISFATNILDHISENSPLLGAGSLCSSICRSPACQAQSWGVVCRGLLRRIVSQVLPKEPSGVDSYQRGVDFQIGGVVQAFRRDGNM